MRRSDSVRFDPYYKVQIWDARSLAWIDIQRSYAAPQDAIDATTGPGRYRLMCIWPGGRRPMDEWVASDPGKV